MAIHSLLIGRDEELTALSRLLDAVRAGQSRALVVCGEPGVGKTALLEHTVESASGFRVVRAVGVESEMELVFAALQQLCAPMLDRLERLPEPQRDALEVAFGLTAGDPPDRFLVGLAALSLLSEVAEDQPLLCVIDDAQWMDRASAQALAFVARRLLAESVAVVFATREQSQELVGLPDLVVEGLHDDDARALLSSVITGPLDDHVRDRFVAETHGNPLALLELPCGLPAGELAGGFGVPDGVPLSGRIEESFRRRLQALPGPTQGLLLIAAAEPVGDPALVRRAAERLGIGVDAARAAEADGLLAIGARVTFRHPLVRSAVYRAASPEDRGRVHGALADATDPKVDPDRRAWHLAHATAEPDEEVAAELERSAGRAEARGGLAAAAAFLEQSTRLTLAPARRADRALAAAQAMYQVGAPDSALELLATADVGPLDELQCARVELLRARIAFALSRGSDAPPLLLKAAKRLEPLDVALARETYLEAFSAAIFAGRMASGVGPLEVAQAARAAHLPSSQPPRAPDLLLDGYTVLFTEGYAAAAPILKRALSAFRSETLSRDEGHDWLLLACRTAMDLWDDESWYLLSALHVQLARDAGALTELTTALALQSGSHVFSGQFAAAEALGDEASSVSVAIGGPEAPYARLILAGWRGREAETLQLVETTGRDAAARGEGRMVRAGEYARAILYNGLGRHQDALAVAQQASKHPEEMSFPTWCLAEVIEAAARSGQPDLAAEALDRLSGMTRLSGTDFALGIEARSRALVSEGAVADSLYREAIERLGRTRAATYLARAHLVYGEWLRRERRRTDARAQLRTAHEMFVSMGAEAFAGRAGRELQAAGETARKRPVQTTGQLTAKEAQIAQLARDGLSNLEIGSHLFISHRTVEYHLRKVFTKLGITSRTQLAQVLPGDANAANPADANAANPAERSAVG